MWGLCCLCNPARTRCNLDERHENETERQFGRFVDAWVSIAKSVASIADTYKFSNGPKVATSFTLLLGGKPVAKVGQAQATFTPIPDNDSLPVAVVGVDSLGILGALLAAGQTIGITVDNALVCAFVEDASALPQTINGVTYPSLISGVLNPATPTLPNTTANVTYTILNADGSTFATGSGAVQVVAGAAVGGTLILSAPVPTVAPTPAPASARPVARGR
jgi:hypothetical protein